jgi:hypothetical protein
VVGSSPASHTLSTEDIAEFTINANTRIQILDELSHLARARKHQYAAFVRDEGVLCVWSDSVKTIVADVEKLEKALLDFVWGNEHQQKSIIPAIPTFNNNVAEAAAPAVDSTDVEDSAAATQNTPCHHVRFHYLWSERHPHLRLGCPRIS